MCYSVEGIEYTGKIFSAIVSPDYTFTYVYLFTRKNREYLFLFKKSNTVDLFPEHCTSHINNSTNQILGHNGVT